MQISNTGRLSATGHEAGDGEAVPRRYLNGARLLLLLLAIYLCGTNLYAALLEGLTVSRASWAIGSAFVMTIGVSSFAGIFFDPRADNFGLKVLLTTITLFASGIVLIAIGPARYRAAGSGSFWREFLAVREVTVALDVLTVLGCAALVVAAGQLWA